MELTASADRIRSGAALAAGFARGRPIAAIEHASKARIRVPDRRQHDDTVTSLIRFSRAAVLRPSGAAHEGPGNRRAAGQSYFSPLAADPQTACLPARHMTALPARRWPALESLQAGRSSHRAH